MVKYKQYKYPWALNDKYAFYFYLSLCTNFHQQKSYLLVLELASC